MRAMYFLLLLTTFPFACLFAQVIIRPLPDSSVSSVALHIKNKEYAKAFAEAERWVRNEPSTGKHYFNRAVARYYQDQYHNSLDTVIINDCKQALELGYENAEVYYLLFSQHFPHYIVWEKEITYADAKALIDRAISERPDVQRYRIARLNFFKQEFNSEEIQPDLGQFELDLKYMLDRSGSPKNRAQYFIQLSNIELYKKSDSAAALGYLSDAIALQPDNDEYRYYRANLKYEMNDDAGAIEDFTIYLSRNKDGEAFVNRGVSYLMQGKTALALNDLNQALVIYEKKRSELLKQNAPYKLNYHKTLQSRAYRVRGLIHQETGNKTKACADFSKALELGSTQAQSLISDYCQ